MKRKMFITTAMLLVAGIAYLAFAAVDTSVSGKEVTVTGKLSCTFCKLAHPDKTCSPECCTNCVKAGDPPALTDAQGNMYLLISGEKEAPLMNAERLKMMGSQVTVKGILVKQGGIQAIYVDTLEKDEGKQVSMTGKLSCSFCKLAHPDKPATPECCTACIKAGDPPLLTDAQGNMYILISGEKEMKLMTPERMAMIGSDVMVKGLLVKQNGMQAIYVDSMDKAKGM